MEGQEHLEQLDNREVLESAFVEPLVSRDLKEHLVHLEVERAAVRTSARPTMEAVTSTAWTPTIATSVPADRDTRSSTHLSTVQAPVCVGSGQQ